jgi:hypothetical protein
VTSPVISIFPEGPIDAKTDACAVECPGPVCQPVTFQRDAVAAERVGEDHPAAGFDVAAGDLAHQVGV